MYAPQQIIRADIKVVGNLDEGFDTWVRLRYALILANRRWNYANNLGKLSLGNIALFPQAFQSFSESVHKDTTFP